MNVQIILKELEYWKNCPLCKSSNTTQTGSHDSDGANSFICNNCGCSFGN